MDNKSLKEEFHKFCPGARDNLLIANWWIAKMDLQRKELAEEIIGEIPDNMPETCPDDLAESESYDMTEFKSQLRSKFL